MADFRYGSRCGSTGQQTRAGYREGLRAPDFLSFVFQIFPVWEDPGPADAHPERFKSHLHEHCDIFPEMMVKIDSLQGGIIISRLDLIHFPDAQHNAAPVRAVRDDVHIGESPTSLPISALTLVGGRGAAP